MIDQLMPIQKAADPLLLGFNDRDMRAIPDHEKLWMWMAGPDVYSCAELTWNGRTTIKNLPDRWVRLLPCNTRQGVQEVYFIAEPGIYHTLSKSKRPEAQRLFCHLFEVILPEIRVNGFFGELALNDQLKALDRLQSITVKMEQGSNKLVRALYPMAERLARQLKLPYPPIEHFLDNQLELEGL